MSHICHSCQLVVFDMPFFKINLCKFDNLFDVPNTMDLEYLIYILKPCQLRF